MTSKPKIWHPFTQHGLGLPRLHVTHGDGVYLHLDDGRRLIDGISSWWINIHGHCHPHIVKAVQEQAAKLEQVIFAGFTHDPAETLADRLLQFCPGYDHVFFSDSGSTAVEVALKMAIGYWAQTGKAKRHIIAFEDGYHGDTFGAMAAGARSVFTALYDEYLFEVHHIPPPAPGYEDQSRDALQTLMNRYPNDLAAFIFEPLVQGAGGMKMHDAAALKALTDLARQNDILLIADEVMTGFGRTGHRFACQAAGFTPDLICLSKGLTGGFLPMGVTLAPRKIYDAFYGDDKAKMFMHSSSFNGNALACAAANASMEIWDLEPVDQRIKNITSWHKDFTKQLNQRDDIDNIRQTGTILAFDVQTEQSGYTASIGNTLYKEFLARGVLLRPLGNTVYILPPYRITQEELNTVYATILDSLDTLPNSGKQRRA